MSRSRGWWPRVPGVRRRWGQSKLLLFTTNAIADAAAVGQGCDIVGDGGAEAGHAAAEAAVERRGLVVGEAEVDVAQDSGVVDAEHAAYVVEVEWRFVPLGGHALANGLALLGVEVDGESDFVLAVYADAAGVLAEGGEVAAEGAEGSGLMITKRAGAFEVGWANLGRRPWPTGRSSAPGRQGWPR